MVFNRFTLFLALPRVYSLAEQSHGSTRPPIAFRYKGCNFVTRLFFMRRSHFSLDSPIAWLVHPSCSDHTSPSTPGDETCPACPMMVGVRILKYSIYLNETELNLDLQTVFRPDFCFTTGLTGSSTQTSTMAFQRASSWCDDLRSRTYSSVRWRRQTLSSMSHPMQWAPSAT